MLHIMKLAVGIRDITHLREVQRDRASVAPPLRHRTRNTPRRAGEVTDGGSIYWVVAGALLVRQRITDITQDRWDDGTRCTGLLLDPALVQVEGRPVKAFQGWRYLDAAQAPPDLQTREDDPHGMPPALRMELRTLCLL